MDIHMPKGLTFSETTSLDIANAMLDSPIEKLWIAITEDTNGCKVAIIVNEELAMRMASEAENIGSC